MGAKSGLFFTLLSLGLLMRPQHAVANRDDEEVEEDINDNDSDAATDDEKQPEAVKAEPLVGSAGYRGGFFVSDGGTNKLVIQGRVQARGEFTSVDEGTGNSRGRKSALLLPRVRLTLKGSAYTKRLGYKFQTDFGKGQAALKDFYLDYRVGAGEIRVRLGQFKLPFGRQGLNSSSRLEFVDRSIVDKYVGNGRDIGIGLHNNAAKSPRTEWAFGIFNGTGEKGTFRSKVALDATTGTPTVESGKFSNVPAEIRPAIAIRVGRNSEGMKGYREADIEGGGFRYGVAAALLTHFRYGVGKASTRAGVDFVVKQEGLSATGGAYANLKGPKVADLSYVGLGAYLQLGYMIGTKKQIAARYASISETGGNNQQEASLVYSHYEFGHGLKWQTDVSYLFADDGIKRTDYRGRTQVQLSF